MKSIIIINGPNLNLLGQRETSIYGDQSFEDYFIGLRKKYPTTILHYFQTNHEGAIIDKMQAVNDLDGIILNAAGYTHTSIAIADTIRAIKTPVVEVHISDINNREDYRKHSYVKEPAVKSIIGKGLAGYDEAIEYILAC